MNRITTWALIVISLLSGQTFSAGDVVAGKAKSGVCSACHGKNGIAVIPGYPNLKGQKEQYLINAINAYKSGQRTGGMAAIMEVQANLLSGDDIANLAAYYSHLE
ncbi:c-type cytochrome [Vibrio sagamiensis]|uniref:Cytochrome c biogenesis protein CcsB n=1 Tax=Vibrio sagamiensis NBRC 104589 TaxID=1219064 RepID=A0A511Q9Y4_9VIBR|nr:cytochrome c [Vibrio sagamiensis]PNQ71902.1 cytochrome C biogenesis protein CcsB [Vibrio agarivorans]GEM74087.1 cytochrome c biogenesis protein CcsB [Vibrio sagamiensis NBRC 104589]